MGIFINATAEQLWKVVNKAETLQEIRSAEGSVLFGNVTNEEYDELMMALAEKEREIHREELKRNYK